MACSACTRSSLPCLCAMHVAFRNTVSVGCACCTCVIRQRNCCCNTYVILIATRGMSSICELRKWEPQLIADSGRVLQARQLFTNHMHVVVNRVNTFTGVAYKNDPTIFACADDLCFGCLCAANCCVVQHCCSTHSKTPSPERAAGGT